MESQLIPPPALPAMVSAPPEPPFGANEVRLSARLWALALLVLCGVMALVPELWRQIESFATGPDYRMPYQLSKDYWLYQRWLSRAVGPDRVILLGDSVVWGEYVLPDGTLSHFLNRQAGVSNRFVNAGLNGLFPLAEEGLIDYYGRCLRHQKVLLHCNLLWLTSPKADLSTEKEEQFNHSRLVAQFVPRIRCYKADANERLSAVFERNVGFVQWVDHLQNAYFGQKSILRWTLEEDAGNPPGCPNGWKNPLTQITLRVPPAPVPDPQRGPDSARHKPWSVNSSGPTRFDWVPLQASLQWSAFQRLVSLLRSRGNDVLVVLGPFNEHMLTEDSRVAYGQLRDGMAAWLTQSHILHVAPDALPSELYADASHPLTQGYELLAKRLFQDQNFRTWAEK